VRYRFGRFTADDETRQLVADGEDVHLSPKAFELLLILIDQRSRAVSKSELLDRLWPSSFVGETSLPVLIAEIRRALGDTAHGAAFVRTVHRFGYRFVAGAAELTTPAAGLDAGARMYLASADRQFPLTEGESVIGRARDAFVRIDSGGVSRHHARILVRGGEARVEDLGSKNGTFVAGTLLTGARLLRDGDEIRVGPVALTFRVAATTAVTETIS